MAEPPIPPAHYNPPPRFGLRPPHDWTTGPWLCVDAVCGGRFADLSPLLYPLGVTFIAPDCVQLIPVSTFAPPRPDGGTPP